MFHRLVSDVPPGTLCPPPVHTCSSWPPSSSRVWAEAQEQQIRKNQTSFFADRLTRPVRSSIVRWPRYSKRQGETNRTTLTAAYAVGRIPAPLRGWKISVVAQDGSWCGAL